MKIHKRSAAVKHDLDPIVRRTRRNFCMQNRNRNWNSVVFSDECNFGLQSDGRIQIWRSSGELHLPECYRFKPTSRSSVMIWGCVTSISVGVLSECSHKMDSKEYIKILDGAAITNLKHFNYIFQHDNYPIHKSRTTCDWLSDNEVPVLQWPPYSPDLNIIENIWGRVKKRIISASPRIETVTEIKKFVVKEWQEIPQKYIDSLYNSMPKRMEKCSKSLGYPIGY